MHHIGRIHNILLHSYVIYGWILDVINRFDVIVVLLRRLDTRIGAVRRIHHDEKLVAALQNLYGRAISNIGIPLQKGR